MSGVLLVIAPTAKAYFSADPINASKTTVTPTDSTADVVFKRDGSIVNHAATVLGYWTNKPNATVGDRFKVKATKSSGDNFTSAAAADDTYTTDISSDRTYRLTETTNGAAQKQWVGTWTVSPLVGSPTDSAAGTVTATVTV